MCFPLGFRVSSGNSLVFIDPSSLRRSGNTSTTTNSSQDGVTMTTTAACLARSFAIVLRQIADLLGSLHNIGGPQELLVPITYQECVDLQVRNTFSSLIPSALFRKLILYPLKKEFDYFLNVLNN